LKFQLKISSGDLRKRQKKLWRVIFAAHCVVAGETGLMHENAVYRPTQVTLEAARGDQDGIFVVV